MLWASRHGDPWLVFFESAKGSPGVTTKVTATSVEAAVKRIEKGEEPPRMPSERKLTYHPQSGDDDVEKPSSISLASLNPSHREFQKRP